MESQGRIVGLLAHALPGFYKLGDLAALSNQE